MYQRTVLSLVLIASLSANFSLSALAKEYKGNKFKGTVESVGTVSLTLADEGDSPIEFFVTAKTTITREERPAEFQDIQPDDVAIVTAMRSGDKMIAKSIFVMEPR